jgi:S-layer protein
LILTAASTALTSFNASGNTTTDEFQWTSGATVAALTVVGTAAGANTINVSAATKAVTYTGSSGVDAVVLAATTEANTLTLGNGANVVTGASAGNNVITGGSGADTFTTATTGNNTINFGDGANAFTATTGNNTYTGGTGVDNVTVTSGNNTISTGTGNDVVSIGGGVNTVDVGSGTDSVTLTAPSTTGTLYSTLTGIGVADTVAFTGLNGTPTFVTAKIGTQGPNAVFTDYLNAATTGVGGTNDIAQWFQFGGNTYVVVDASAVGTYQDGVDSVVEIAGLVTINGFTGAAGSATFLLA